MQSLGVGCHPIKFLGNRLHLLAQVYTCQRFRHTSCHFGALASSMPPLAAILFLGERRRCSRQVEQNFTAIMERCHGNATRLGRFTGRYRDQFPSLTSRSTTAGSSSLGAVARLADSISEMTGCFVAGFVGLDIPPENGVERGPVPAPINHAHTNPTFRFQPSHLDQARTCRPRESGTGRRQLAS
jgi:hypothetical protein